MSATTKVSVSLSDPSSLSTPLLSAAEQASAHATHQVESIALQTIQSPPLPSQDRSINATPMQTPQTQAADDDFTIPVKWVKVVVTAFLLAIATLFVLLLTGYITPVAALIGFVAWSAAALIAVKLIIKKPVELEESTVVGNSPEDALLTGCLEPAQAALIQADLVLLHEAHLEKENPTQKSILARKILNNRIRQALGMSVVPITMDPDDLNKLLSELGMRPISPVPALGDSPDNAMAECIEQVTEELAANVLLHEARLEKEHPTQKSILARKIMNNQIRQALGMSVVPIKMDPDDLNKLLSELGTRPISPVPALGDSPDNAMAECIKRVTEELAAKKRSCNSPNAI